METTINMHIGTQLKIDRAARILGMSRSAIIVLLIKKLMGDISDPAQPGTMIRYQERRGPGDWHAFHVKLRMDEYEYFLDLRKLLKMSVSLILSYAVKKFLGRMIKINITDNYPYKNYVVIREVVEDIISWRIIWGYPRHIEKLIS